ESQQQSRRRFVNKSWIFVRNSSGAAWFGGTIQVIDHRPMVNRSSPSLALTLTQPPWLIPHGPQKPGPLAEGVHRAREWRRRCAKSCRALPVVLFRPIRTGAGLWRARYAILPIVFQSL